MKKMITTTSKRTLLLLTIICATTLIGCKKEVEKENPTAVVNNFPAEYSGTGIWKVDSLIVTESYQGTTETYTAQNNSNIIFYNNNEFDIEDIDSGDLYRHTYQFNATKTSITVKIVGYDYEYSGPVTWNTANKMILNLNSSVDGYTVKQKYHLTRN